HSGLLLRTPPSNSSSASTWPPLSFSISSSSVAYIFCSASLLFVALRRRLSVSRWRARIWRFVFSSSSILDKSLESNRYSADGSRVSGGADEGNGTRLDPVDVEGPPFSTTPLFLGTSFTGALERGAKFGNETAT